MDRPPISMVTGATLLPDAPSVRTFLCAAHAGHCCPPAPFPKTSSYAAEVYQAAG